jgi:hypothetical protein
MPERIFHTGYATFRNRDAAVSAYPDRGPNSDQETRMGPMTENQSVEIESFQDTDKSGLHAKVSLRPIRGQKFSASLRLEGNKSLTEDYPVGTRFRVQAALATRPTGGQYLYTSWQWDSKVLSLPDEAA